MNFFDLYWRLFQEWLISALCLNAIWLYWVILFILLAWLPFKFYQLVQRKAQKRDADIAALKRELNGRK